MNLLQKPDCLFPLHCDVSLKNLQWHFAGSTAEYKKSLNDFIFLEYLDLWLWQYKVLLFCFFLICLFCFIWGGYCNFSIAFSSVLCCIEFINCSCALGNVSKASKPENYWILLCLTSSSVPATISPWSFPKCVIAVNTTNLCPSGTVFPWSSVQSPFLYCGQHGWRKGYFFCSRTFVKISSTKSLSCATSGKSGG